MLGASFHWYWSRIKNSHQEFSPSVSIEKVYSVKKYRIGNSQVSIRDQIYKRNMFPELFCLPRFASCELTMWVFNKFRFFTVGFTFLPFNVILVLVFPPEQTKGWTFFYWLEDFYCPRHLEYSEQSTDIFKLQVQKRWGFEPGSECMFWTRLQE